MLSTYELIIRLVLSAVIGGLIGMEREANNRPAGLRTHILVTLGSSLIMLLSTQGFDNLSSSGDPARLAAQVVSGIGFLGAGTILRTGNSISGLTTAASIWVCGGIGLAIGGGYYVGGLMTAAIVLFSLMSLGVVEKRVFAKKYKILIVQCKERTGLIGDIGQIFGRYNITIKDIHIINIEEDYDYRKDEFLETLDSVGSESSLEIHFALKLLRNLNKRALVEEINNISGVEDVLWSDDDRVGNI
ncbi:MgtC/SapB family protein [Alkaliphilus peptidifermentans]|uniref:Putative Mg2+ transporter-C (MgtC) family protein n=1 Tax=Alkaliphilus peptidifermentans DSM 18978 TaxID=1120976 RepID=A0A1G5KMQ9_9FIRM|nr:MgtC/SapB family protein [Alkaliphilus peptidifermentans]SCZ01852.1 putative Mg2+ transporter-C (MgtC) family protein [Alkaliphilus peptidifermentans DSM 18978]